MKRILFGYLLSLKKQNLSGLQKNNNIFLTFVKEKFLLIRSIIIANNVTSTIPVFLQEIQDILCDCNTQELRVMVETMRSIQNNKWEN